MCRSIKTLFNLDPPAGDDEIRSAALQFARKVSGFRKPSLANKEAFDTCVDEITRSASLMLKSLTTTAPSRNREQVAAKARARASSRFGAG